MELRKLTVEGFINETASSSPAPGGGSVAALNAASSAALIAMVADLTIGKEKYKASEEEMKDIAKAGALKDQFLSLIDEDSNAFNKIMAAFKLPKDTDEAKKARSAAIQEATKGAALVPFKVGETANTLFALAEAVILRGNPNAVTDGAVAAMNARAAVRGAFLNVKINLGSIKDQVFVDDLKAKMAVIEKDVDAREQALLNKVNL